MSHSKHRASVFRMYLICSCLNREASHQILSYRKKGSIVFT